MPNLTFHFWKTHGLDELQSPSHSATPQPNMGEPDPGKMFVDSNWANRFPFSGHVFELYLGCPEEFCPPLIPKVNFYVDSI